MHLFGNIDIGVLYWYVVHRDDRAVLTVMLMCFSSLALIYLLFSTAPTTSPGGNAPFEPGNTVTVYGEVLEVKQTNTGGHLILKLLTSYGVINAFVPGSSGASEVMEIVHRGIEIAITGKVDVYNGELEVVVERASDIVVVND